MTNQLRHLAALTIATIAMAGSAAMAGSINFDYRFDYNNTTYNSDHGSAANSGKSDFMAQTGRLNFMGKFSDDVSYRLQYRLNMDATAIRNDKLNNTIDLMFLTQKINDTMSLTLGKFASGLGGYDGTQSGADIYLASRNWNTIWMGTVNDGTSTSGPSGKKAFVSGAKGTFMIEGHELAVFAANTAEPSSPTAQTRMTTGLTFKGSFMDKALTPYISYAIEKANPPNVSAVTANAASDADTKHTYITLGAKYEMGDWFAALDNSTFTSSKVNTSASTPGDMAQNSLVLNAGYTMEKMTYKLMYDTSTFTSTPTGGTASKLAYTGTSLAAEYRPTTDKNFRYHLAYTTLSEKADTAGATAKVENHLIAGVRLNADFLK